MLNQYSVRAALVVAALVVSSACSDDAVVGPDTPGPNSVALVELEGSRPAFYIQNTDATSRTRIHFNGAADQVPNNSPLVPPLTDANILTLRSAKWSPDGTRIAFVATVAADQAEVIVMNADGTGARVVSPNYAYVLGDVDWSSDGARLTYVMATKPGLGGLEVFVSELSTIPRVTKVTTNSGYRGLGGTVRFASGGNSVWISQVTGEGGAPLFQPIGAVRRVDLTTGVITSVKEGIAGEVQAVSHDGTYAIVLRHKSFENNVYVDQLVRVPLVGTGPEQLLVDGGELWYARLTTSDSRVLLLRAGNALSTFTPTGTSQATLRGAGGDVLSVDLKS
jgi:Tol biopolymer transport system component